MRRRRLKLLSICESHIVASGSTQIGEDFIFHNSGATSGSTNIGGVGFIHSKDIVCERFLPMSNRIAIGWFIMYGYRLKAIVVYSPTEEKSKSDSSEVEELYESIQQASATKNPDEQTWPLMILGDFNCRIGPECHEVAPANFGSHTIAEATSDNGVRLAELTAELDLRIANTFFQKKLPKLTTWRHPRTQTPAQLDYILYQYTKIRVTDTRASWSESTNSDHAMLVSIIQIDQRERKSRKSFTPPKLQDLIKSALRDTATSEQLEARLRVELEFTTSYDDLIDKVTTIVTKSAKSRKRKHKEWYDHLDDQAKEDLKERLKVRRQMCCETRDAEQLRLRTQLRELNKSCKAACRAAKNTFVEIKLKVVQNELDDGNSSAAFEALNSILPVIELDKQSWFLRNARSSSIKPELMQKHYEELFRARRASKKESLGPVQNVDPPSQVDVAASIHSLKRGKAPGANGITGDLLKAFPGIFTPPITSIIQAHWNSPLTIPQAWKDAEVISLHKKGSRDDPNNYRSIFLLDTIGKIFCKLLVQSLNRYVDHKLDPYQFGFRNGRSGDQAIVLLRNAMQTAKETKTPMVLVFIDLTKAFDSIDRNYLWSALRYFEVPDHLTQIVQSIHDTPIGRLRNTMLSFRVERGVRQGCVLGPTLFTIAFHYLCRDIIDEKCLNHIAYADDVVLVTKSTEEAQNLLEKMQLRLSEACMQMSDSKTKAMFINTKPTAIKVNDREIEPVTSFCYLGSLISSDCEIDLAIQANVTKARLKLTRIKPALKSNELSMKVKCAFLEMFLKSTLLNGLATTIVRENDRKKLEAVLNTGKRVILRIRSRKDKTIEELNDAVPTKPVMIDLAKRRLRLYASIHKIANRAIRQTLGKKRTATRDWSRHVGCNAADFNLSEDWMANPTTISFDEVPTKLSKQTGQRELIIKCRNENCRRMFARTAEMNRHFRNDHQQTTSQIEDPKKCSIGQTHKCPLADCSKVYSTSGWLARHMKSCHPSATTTVSTDNVSSPQTREVRPVHKCPFCPKSATKLKTLENHCTKEHNWSLRTNGPSRARATKGARQHPKSFADDSP